MEFSLQVNLDYGNTTKLLRIETKREVELPVKVRNARMDDYKSVEGYILDFSNLHLKNQPRLFNIEKVTEREAHKYFKYALKNEDSKFMVAELNRETAGYMKIDFETIPDVFCENNTLYIDSIYVGSKFRRNGIAKALMLSAEEIAKENSVKRIQMRVYTFNTQMQSLAISMGYNAPFTTWDKLLEYESRNCNSQTPTLHKK